MVPTPVENSKFFVYLYIIFFVYLYIILYRFTVSLMILVVKNKLKESLKASHRLVLELAVTKRSTAMMLMPIIFND